MSNFHVKEAVLDAASFTTRVVGGRFFDAGPLLESATAASLRDCKVATRSIMKA